MTALGLTWDHPRGKDALAEAARRVNAHRANADRVDTDRVDADRGEPLIRWETQPLEGFESAPIADLAARHDLLVMDHPHIGEAVAEECLIPLDDLYPPEQIAAWAARSVGPSLASYVWQGRTWALPLDVAAQVMARRAGALATPPESWDAVDALATERRVALSLAGPHALLTLFSMCGSEGVVPGGEDLLPETPALEAIARMARLHAAQPAGTAELNPIGLLEAMAEGALDLVPLVFGYVPYAAPGPRQIAYSDPPGSTRAGATGGVLGGTGIAFSHRARPSPDLLAHVADLLEEETQRTLFPAFSGQPSARAAWLDPAVNNMSGEFYAATRTSTEKALLRPRFDGFIAFQTAASARLRAGLAAGDAPETLLVALRSLWREARARASGPLEGGALPPYISPSRSAD